MKRILLFPLPALSLALPAAGQAPWTIDSPGNPILADGDYYSADPAPVVAGDTLYVLAGRDEAPADVNDFIMKEWQLLATRDVARRRWTHHPAMLKPEQVFSWAEPGRAYASQIVRGTDGRYYLYAPVVEKASTAEDRFAIGVAVADSPLGPWTDAHPTGPIVSQSRPEPNRIQNIDPTVLVDDDGRVYLYWGTFGRLRGVELAPDMVTPKGPVVHVTSLRGFFEAPWLMKRRGTYYMLYAGNEAGPQSPCTDAIYHACIAYGTAPSPLGPWTYRGVILDPVSSTTSHPGAVEFKGQWYLTYHTADAKGGGHFRRSVAVDRLAWDDSVSPAAIRKVVPTRAPQPPRPAQRNIAAAARITASNDPIPVKYRLKAVNDGKAPTNPLPPEMWATGPQQMLSHHWLQYEWAQPVTLNSARLWFFADRPVGAGDGIAPPKTWHLEWWDGQNWQKIKGVSAGDVAPGGFHEVRFEPITTRCLRAVFAASASDGRHAAVAVEEWEALAPRPLPPVPAPDPRADSACRTG